MAMQAAIASVQTDLSPGGKTLALRLQTFVRKTTQQMSKRFLTGSSESPALCGI
jgi:hypothetical protein